MLASTAGLVARGLEAQQQQPRLTPGQIDAIAHALVARGDTMMLAGRLFGAESVYYRAARIAPHDGTTRLALGKFLAGRGALRIGATLMEEARHFGADAGLVAVDIAPVYAKLGVIDSLSARKNDWSALAALPSSAIR